MFAALARFSYRCRWPIVAVFLGLFPIAGIYGGGVFTVLKGGGFDDPTAESYRAVELIEKQLGTGDAVIVALYTAPGSAIEDGASAASGD